MPLNLKSHEPIQLGPIRGLAEYIPTRTKDSRIDTGWMLRLPVGDVAIEGWGTTQDEALFMFKEVASQWLKDTNRLVAIR